MTTSYNLLISNSSFIADASCSNIVPYDYIRSRNLQCYDKDGYELTKLEKLYYEAQGYKLNRFLNKHFLGSSWLALSDHFPHPNLYIEHSMLLNRCNFVDKAREQIDKYRHKYRLLNYLMHCKPKWGVDIALDWITDEKIYEIIHLEYDSYNINEAIEKKACVEEFFISHDLEDVARRIISKYDEWSPLTGYHQNYWKAKYLGFSCSEDTQKSI